MSKRKKKIRQNRARNLAKLANKNPDRLVEFTFEAMIHYKFPTFEAMVRHKFPNLAEVKFLPIVNTKVDLSSQPHEEIENFWDMYRKKFPDWD